MYYQDLADYQVAQAELEALVGLDQKISGAGKRYITSKRQ
jgi:hypothetical protein